MGALTTAVLAELAAERARQTAKHGDQSRLPSGTGRDADLWWLSGSFGRLACTARDTTQAHAESGTVSFADILLEEVFEALAEAEPARLRAELVQVAAVAVQWVEAIDRRSCARCDIARHNCPGCDGHVEHGQVACGACERDHAPRAAITTVEQLLAVGPERMLRAHEPGGGRCWIATYDLGDGALMFDVVGGEQVVGLTAAEAIDYFAPLELVAYGEAVSRG